MTSSARSIDCGLLEREDALTQVAGLIERLRVGEGDTLVVESPAGTGKTALLAAAVEIARGTEVRPLEARGGELEQDFPFGIARQLFERAVLEAPSGLRADLLDGPSQSAARLLGVTRPEITEPASPQAVVHGLYWLALTLSGIEPLLLVVDDVQWADGESWDWLRYLARRAGGAGVGLLVAGRAEVVQGSEHRAAEIAETSDAPLIRLEGLSEDGVGELLGLKLGEAPDAAFARASHGLTHGNPFFVVELAHEVASSRTPPTAENAGRLEQMAPDRIGWSINARLGRLGERARLAADVLAVFAHASLTEVARLADMEVAEAAGGLDLLVAHELVKEDGDFRFIHPVVRRAIYEDLPPARRSVMHRAAAEVIAGAGAPIERVAGQLAHVPPAGDEWLAAQLLTAAQKASSERALSATVSYLSRAADEQVPKALRTEIVSELGLAEARLRLPSSRGHLSEAIQLTEDSARRVELTQALARTIAFEGRVAEGVELLEREIERLGEDSPDLVWDLELELQGFGRTSPETFERSNVRLLNLIQLAAQDASFDRRLDHILVQRPCWEGSDWRESDRRAAASIEARPNPFISDPEWIGQYFVVQALGWCDQYDRALAQLDLAFSAAGLQGSIIGHVLASSYRADVHLRRGAFAEAEADAGAAVELIDEHRLQVPAALAFSYLVIALVERGRSPEAWEVLRRHGLHEQIPEQHVFALLYAARAYLHLATRQPGHALDDALHAGSLLAALGPGPAPCGWRSTAALAAHAAGKPTQARELAEEDLRLAQRFGAPRPLGIALRTAALVAEDDPISLLSESVESLRGSDACAELARSLIELGSALRRRRQPAHETRPLLQDALDLAHRSGASLVEQRARDELVAAGGRPRRPSLRGIDALTPRELRVAELAASGCTNRQIAQILFVAPRTVEHHLRSVYRKLAITSREQLGEALQGTGLQPEEGSATAVLPDAVTVSGKLSVGSGAPIACPEPTAGVVADGRRLPPAAEAPPR